MYLWAPNRAQHLISNLRFIPAGAGNTLAYKKAPSGDGGSSPRMRGILSGEWKWLDAFRFIPADAGNTTLPVR